MHLGWFEQSPDTGTDVHGGCVESLQLPIGNVTPFAAEQTCHRYRRFRRSIDCCVEVWKYVELLSLQRQHRAMALSKNLNESTISFSCCTCCRACLISATWKRSKDGPWHRKPNSCHVPHDRLTSHQASTLKTFPFQFV